MSPLHILLAFIVGTIATVMLTLYLLAHLAGRREERARKNAEEKPDDAQPSPSP